MSGTLSTMWSIAMIVNISSLSMTPSIQQFTQAVLLVPLEGVDDLPGHAQGVLFGEEEDERDDVLWNHPEGSSANAGSLPDESPLLSPVRPSRCCACVRAGRRSQRCCSA